VVYPLYREKKGAEEEFIKERYCWCLEQYCAFCGKEIPPPLYFVEGEGYKNFFKEVLEEVLKEIKKELKRIERKQKRREE